MWGVRVVAAVCVVWLGALGGVHPAAKGGRAPRAAVRWGAVSSAAHRKGPEDSGASGGLAGGWRQTCIGQDMSSLAAQSA